MNVTVKDNAKAKMNTDTEGGGAGASQIRQPIESPRIGEVHINNPPLN